MLVSASLNDEDSGEQLTCVFFFSMTFSCCCCFREIVYVDLVSVTLFLRRLVPAFCRCSVRHIVRGTHVRIWSFSVFFFVVVSAVAGC